MTARAEIASARLELASSGPTFLDGEIYLANAGMGLP